MLRRPHAALHDIECWYAIGIAALTPGRPVRLLSAMPAAWLSERSDDWMMQIVTASLYLLRCQRAGHQLGDLPHSSGHHRRRERA